jgi:hypothetical protein
LPIRISPEIALKEPKWRGSLHADRYIWRWNSVRGKDRAGDRSCGLN